MEHGVEQFSSLYNLTKRQWQDPIAVLRVIEQTGRFSVFEITGNIQKARMLESLVERGWMISAGFPWIGASITPEGRAIINL